MAYDSQRAMTVLFGGWPFVLGDTWERDGTNWIERNPTVSPPARFDHAMAYDKGRGVTVMFGGREIDGPNNPLNDTWEWSGTEWVQRTPATVPPARYGQAMAFDATRGVVIMFGGRNGNSVLGDTWVWDGNDWTQLSPATSPPLRYLTAMAFDSARQVAVLFGGKDGAEAFLGDTWEWDGTTWTERTPQSAPGARYSTAMAYDSQRQVTVLFGGGNGWGDTWEWDGVNWTQREVIPRPSPRAEHALVYDERRHAVVLFGGMFQRTWEWDGVQWTEFWREGSPPPRDLAGLAYDRDREVTVLFGGRSALQNFRDTWEWNGTVWTQRFPVTSPPADGVTALAYDSGRKKTVLFYWNGTWEWDGVNWTQRFPAHSPTKEGGPRMVYDSARGVIVLYSYYGGENGAGTTWEWDGNDWIQRTPVHSPPANGWYGMAYDSRRQVTVVYGGYIPPGETWEWDGNDWTKHTPATAPGWMTGPVMAFDEARGVSVLMAGRCCSGTGDTWEWDGNDWTYAPQPTYPSNRTYEAMAYDSVRQKSILFGGRLDADLLDDTWEYGGEVVATPTPTPIASVCTTQTDIPQAECEALVTLYNSTNGASWYDSPANNWNLTDTPCRWAGVTCSAGSPGHVTEINRSRQNLDGTIPDLSALSSLQSLDLSYNKLNGSFPAALPTSLHYLNLDAIGLSGTIPDLSAFTNLQAISLGFNPLGGSIPDFSALTSLQYLNLGYTQLSGNIPTTLPTSLHSLALNANRLSGSIPDLSAFTSLSSLDLHINQLSGSIPDLSALTSLQFLDLSNNHLGGSVPTNLPTSLQYLDLNANQLSGSVPDFSAHTRLQFLYLYNNQLSGSIPAGVCNAAFPDMGYNKLTGEDDPCVTIKDPAWASTQTVAPTNVQANSISSSEFQLTWTPILYTGDGGYYEVLCGLTSGGPYAVQGRTADKSDTGLTLGVPIPATPYYCVLRTFTPNHGGQQNDLTSLNSAEVVVAPGSLLADAGGPYSGNEGSPIALNASSSSPSASITRYQWDCTDNGSYDVSSSRSTGKACTYADSGTYRVRLRVTDASHNTAEDTAVVTVNNVPPKATLSGAPTSLNEGGSFTLKVTKAEDPSSVDTAAGFQYAFDCGDGLFSTWSAASSHTCASVESGTLTVQGRIKDKDGDYNTYSAVVVVKSVAPSATFSNDGPVNEGSTFSLSLLNATDPSQADTLAGFQYSFDCGNGAGFGSWGIVGSRVCPGPADDGSRTVKGQIRDKDGATHTYTADLKVNNVAPVAQFNADPCAHCTVFSLHLTNAVDPSSTDTSIGFTYSFDCGDGKGFNAFGVANSRVCTVTRLGARTVKGKIRDKDGGVSTYSLPVILG